MNHTYRLAWNRALSMFVAVSECARAMGKSAGGKALAAAALLLGIAASPAAQAQTTTFGYDFSRYNSVGIWFGTPNAGAALEGSINFVGGAYTSTAPTMTLASSKPAGLIDGVTNFYSNGSAQVATGVAAQKWQGTRFSGATPGTYTFTYIDAFAPTGNWTPIDNVLRTGSITVTAEQLESGAGVYIDTYNPFYSASKKQATGTLIFEGGTLKIDTDNLSLAQNFTLSGFAADRIDQAGNRATLSGVMSDPALFVGNILFTNSGTGGQVTLTGVNTHTGTTTVEAGANLALAGSGSIASSFSLTNDGIVDIAAASGPVSVNQLDGSGALVLGANTMKISNPGWGVYSGTISGSGGLNVVKGNETLSGVNTYTGVTQIDAPATVRMSGSGSIADSSDVVANGYLYFMNASSAALRSLSGSGVLDLGSNTLNLSAASGNFSGTIYGTGGLTIAAGTQTLSGISAYTGTTRVDSGARLNLSASGYMPQSQAMVLNGTLDVSGVSFAPLVNKLSGSGSLILGSRTLMISNGEASFDGTISGTGGLNILSAKQTLTNTNSYSGGTLIQAAGTLALSGNGAIANSSTVHVNGTLDISATNAGATMGGLTGTGNVLLGGKHLTTNTSGTFHGTMSGSGGLTVAGGFQSFSKALDYTGSTTVASGATMSFFGTANMAASSGALVNGTLDLSQSSGISSLRALTGSGNVVINSSGLALSAAAGNFSGRLSGGGTFAVAAGSQSLSGGNLHFGATQINAGASLALTGSGSIANSSGVTSNGVFDVSGASGQVSIKQLAGSGSVVLGANTLRLTQGSSQTFAGIISGSGGLSLSPGTEFLSGVNTYTGVTQVDTGSALRLSGAGSVASSSNIFLNGGMFSIAAANSDRTQNRISGTGSLELGARNLTLSAAAGTFSGNIFGTGGLTVAGGVQALSTTQNYTGDTRINSGARVNLVSGASMFKSNAAIVNGTLDGSASALQDIQLNRLSGNGSVLIGSKTLFVSQAGTTFDGVISGSGNLYLGTGTQTLTGANSYTGWTTISAPATLALSGNGAIASVATVFVNGTLDISASNGGASVGGVGGTGTVALGAKELTIRSAGETVFGGAINGAGGVTVASGKQILTGTLGYTGATRVAAGATLELFGTANLNASGSVVADGAVSIAASTGAANLRTLSGSGSVTLNSSGMSLSAAAHNFSGSLHGSGGLNLLAGTETLSGVNYHLGPTQIASGATLALGGNGSLVNSRVINNGALVIGTTAPASLVSVSGPGAINLAGQSLVLTNATGNYGGAITGTGGLTIAGGVQQLSGVNAFAGPVSVTGGATLQVASSANLGGSSNALALDNGTLIATGSLATTGALSLANAATVRADADVVVALNGAASGSGSLTKSGAGTLTLGGSNSAYSGALNIDAGTLRLNAAGAAGSGAIDLRAGTLQTGASMTLAQAISMASGTTFATDAGTIATLNGAVSVPLGGTACVAKAGAGTLNLAGGGTFGSGLCVNEGTLRLNGLVTASGVNVAAGATLRGGGTLNMPLTVAGILAPGNSPGALTTSGTVTMLPGSTFQQDINGTGTASGPGNYSRLIVTGSGQFVAGGATLAPNLVNITGADTYVPYVPQLGDSYRIVTAAGGLVGRFGTVVQPTGLAPQTRLAAFYDADGTHSIDLRVLPTSYQLYLGANGGNRNAQVSGDVLDRLLSASEAGTASAGQQVLATTLSGMNASTIQTVALGMSGEIHGAMAAVAPQAGQTLQGTVTRQLDMGRSAPGGALWADMNGKRARWNADEFASGFRADRGQLTVGADVWRSNVARAGLGLSHGRAKVDAAGGSGTLQDNLLFAYGEHQGARIKFDAIAGVGRSSWETSRSNPLGAGVLRSEADGSSVMAGAGLSLPGQMAGVDVAPFARLLWQRVERDAASEGAASAALALNDYSADGVRTTVGLAGNIKGGVLRGAPYTVQYSAAIGHDSGALARPLVGTTLAGMADETVAPNAGRTFAQGSIAGSMTHSAKTSSYFGISAELRSGRTDLSLNGGLRHSF